MLAKKARKQKSWAEKKVAPPTFPRPSAPERDRQRKSVHICCQEGRWIPRKPQRREQLLLFPWRQSPVGSRQEGRQEDKCQQGIPWCFNEAIRAPGFQTISAKGGSIVESLAQPPHFIRAVTIVPRGEKDFPRVIVSSRKGLEPRPLTS